MSDALDPAKRNSPLANSSHRAIRWRRPSGHANHPKLQELTISRLLDAVEKVTSHRTAIQSCPLWNDLGNRINVFDPPPPSPDEPAAPAPPSPASALLLTTPTCRGEPINSWQSFMP